MLVFGVVDEIVDKVFGLIVSGVVFGGGGPHV